MNQWIEQCKSWLEQRYKDVLNISLIDSPEKLRWRQVDRADFRSECETNSVGILEDAELGVLLIFLPLQLDHGGIEDQIGYDISLALRLRSELLPKYSGSQTADTKKDDPFGTWRVCLHWIIPISLKPQWLQAVMEQRGRSGAFDEIPIDAIFVEDEKTVQEALNSHKIPRLLLETRRVLGLPVDQLETWANADVRVREALTDFAEGFADQRQKTIAADIERLVKEHVFSNSPTHPENASTLDSVEVCNFRAIKSIRLEGAPGARDGQQTKAWIIHGPNGTGKSSLGEALALRSMRVSNRYLKFLEDPDETSDKNPKGYIKRYLVPYEHKNTDLIPKCFVNGNGGPLTESDLVNTADEARALLMNCNGTISSQEETQEFANLTSGDLYARVASSFSDLARKVQEYSEQGYKFAHERRKSNNARFGLNATAKRRDTISMKIVHTRISDALLPPASGAAAYLERLGRIGGFGNDGPGSLLKRWRSTVEPDEDLSRALAKLRDLGAANETVVANTIEKKVRDYAAIIEDTRQYFSQFTHWRRDLELELPELTKHALEWKEWLVGLANDQTKPASYIQSDSQMRAEITAKVAEILEARTRADDARKRLQARLDHLATTLLFLQKHWERDNPDTCPTCDTNLSDRGGIRAAIETLQQPIELEIADLRMQYEAHTNELNTRLAQIAVQGKNECPVPESDRKRLDHVIGNLVGAEISVERLLVLPDTRDDVRWLLEFAMRPSASAPDEMTAPNDVAKRIAADIVSEWQKSDEIAEGPEAWEAVRAKLQTRIKDVVANHLPMTVGSVWWEIAAALTNAPWLLPEKDLPKFAVEIYRSTPRVHLRIGEDRLVRHFLNNAEKHILGLAWVFARHVTHGRFHHAWLLLDDPAQEMDQPTFRDLARFLATLLRLYERNKSKFCLALFLHQEERALDAARELDCGLYLLGWMREQRGDVDPTKTTVRSMGVYGPGFHSPLPERWFSTDDTAVVR